MNIPGSEADKIIIEGLVNVNFQRYFYGLSDRSRN